MPPPFTDPFDECQRREWARAALQRAADAAGAGRRHHQVPPDLVPPDGWRWRVLADLTALSKAVSLDYQRAKTRQQRQAWESRFAGPLATGGSAAVGSVISAVGVGLVRTNAVAGWVVFALGVVFAFGGSILSANNYVQNRNKQLRFLRLLYELWDFAYMVLPTASATETFTQLDTFRSLWETAGK
jgi:hypothetical protein